MSTVSLILTALAKQSVHNVHLVCIFFFLFAIQLLLHWSHYVRIHFAFASSIYAKSALYQNTHVLHYTWWIALDFFEIFSTRNSDGCFEHDISTWFDTQIQKSYRVFFYIHRIFTLSGRIELKMPVNEMNKCNAAAARCAYIVFPKFYPETQNTLHSETFRFFLQNARPCTDFHRFLK